MMSSVRYRLMFWNISILAVVLFGFLLIVHVSVRSYLLSAADNRLKGMAERAASMSIHPSPDFPPQDDQARFNNRERMVRRFDLDGRLIRRTGEPALEQEPPLDDAAFTAATFGTAVFSTVEADGAIFRIYSHPIMFNGVQTGVIQSAVSYSEIHAMLQNLTVTLTILVPVALVIAGLGGLFLTNRALRPVRKIVDGANELDANDLSQRLPVVGADEFAHLATTFNGLLSRLEATFIQLKDRIERERRFTADASHELRTPLTAIKANTSLALRGERSADQYKDTLRMIDQSADAMNCLVQDLLLLTRSDSGQLSPVMAEVDAAELFRQAVEMSAGEVHSATVRCVVEPGVKIRGDRHHLLRLVGNLLDNALRHTPVDGQIILTAGVDGDSAVISVADSGEGIDPEHLPHLCERFYRVDDARAREQGGVGLGLAICSSIVDAHNGTISISSTPGIGTRVTVIIPAK